MNRSCCLVSILLLAICCYISPSSAATYYSDDVFVENLKLFVNGTEFIIKGMSYNPVPLGISNMTSDGYDGAGYCSPKETAFGDYESACFNSDYFDGATNPGRYPPGPTDPKTGKLKPWFQDLWTRDLGKIAAMGVNAIRVYNLNLITKTLLDLYPNSYPGIQDSTVAAIHVDFMNAAYAAGLKVIVPIVQDQNFLLTSSDQLINNTIEATIRELGNHPALLMWCLGNELDIYNNEHLLNIVVKKIKVVREMQMSIHNRRIPVTHAVIDYPDMYEWLVQVLGVDVFTANAGYRDVVLDPLWDGQNYTEPNGTIYNFVGWTELSKKYNVPLFIGEMGMNQVDNQVTEQRPDWFNQQYKEILAHVKDGCIGTCFFEYLDEMYKPQLQSSMGVYTPSVNIVNGESSIVMNDFIADKVSPKKYIYTAIAQGETGIYNAKQYNYGANVWDLLGRQPATVPVVQRVDPIASISGNGGFAGRASASGNLGQNSGPQITGGNLLEFANNSNITRLPYVIAATLLLFSIAIGFMML